MPKCDQLEFGIDNKERLTVKFLDAQDGGIAHLVSKLKLDDKRIQGEWERRVYGKVISQFKSLGVSHTSVIDTERL